MRLIRSLRYAIPVLVALYMPLLLDAAQVPASRGEVIEAVVAASREAKAEGGAIPFRFSMGEGRLAACDAKEVAVLSGGSRMVLSWSALPDRDVAAIAAALLPETAPSQNLLARYCLEAGLEAEALRALRRLERMGAELPVGGAELLRRKTPEAPRADARAGDPRAKSGSSAGTATEPRVPALLRPTSSLVFPDDAGHVDVRAKYGAKGDGVTDDTAAINKAISEHLDYHSRMLWLANGTYFVSDTLVSKTPDGKPTFGVQILGQSVEKTIIRLKDASPGYQDPAKPKALLKMCSRNQLDGGNMGHKNFLHNLTVDTGKGNPGAIAIDYTASNTGAIRDVWVRSGDGTGVMGIDMTKPWPGPCLITNVQITGFDYGIRMRHPEYSVTFEHIRLERQRVCGFTNERNIACVRNLQSVNAVPAMETSGILVLLDSVLQGAGDPQPAVRGGGFVYLRNVRAPGYGAVFNGCGPEVGEFASKPIKSLFPSPNAALNLPIEDTPFVPYDPPELWVKATGNLQSAIDKGATTIYIPFGEYRFDRTIVIRGAVRRIHALNANVWNAKGFDGPIFRFEGSAKACVMEWMDSGVVEHASPNALVIRDCTGLSPAPTPGCGPTFVENNCSDPWILKGPARVYGRSVNLEHAEFDIRNHGASLWILGFKSERPGLQVETRDGGHTEILGGLVYPCAPVPADRPMFVNHESSISVIIRHTAYIKDGIHRIKVRETRDGVSKEIDEIGDALYVGYRSPPKPPKNGPAKVEKESPHGAKVAAESPPAPVKVADPAVLAAWDERLRGRVRDALARGARIAFRFGKMQKECILEKAGDGDAIRIRDGGSILDLTWSILSLDDRRGIAEALLADERPGDAALAAFFCLACGQAGRAEPFLARAGGAGDAVRAAFR